MKTTKRILAFLLILCFVPVFSGCIKTISGTFSPDGAVFYTFGETTVNVTVITAKPLEQIHVESFDGTYEINDPLFGSATITISFDDPNAEQYAVTEAAFELDEEKGIVIGDIDCQNAEIPSTEPKPVTYTRSSGILSDTTVSYTFLGDNVTLKTSISLLGQTVTIEADGKYTVNQAPDGTKTITIDFDDTDAEEYEMHALPFTEDKDAGVITIGLVMYVKQK